MDENSIINLIPGMLFLLMALVSFWNAHWYLAILSIGFAILFLRAGFKLSEQLFETRNLHLKTTGS